MLLDHFFITLITVPPLIVISEISNPDRTIGNKTQFLVLYLIILLYTNKDFLNGKSPAKRILGYQVVDLKTGKSASEIQSFLRNLTIFFAWPIEVIIGLINPERRIGDIIANTKLVKSDKQRLTSIWTELKAKTFKFDFVVFIILSCAIYSYAIVKWFLG